MRRPANGLDDGELEAVELAAGCVLDVQDATRSAG